MTTTQATTTIGRLLQARRGDGYKAEAARTIGVSRQIYDAWESGHFIPGDEWVERLADYLDLPIEEIILRRFNDWARKLSPDTPQLDITWRYGAGEWVTRPIDVLAVA